MFKSYSTAQNSFLFHNLVFGLIAPIVVGYMLLFGGTVKDIAKGISWVLCIIPQFAFGHGFLNMTFMETYGYFDGETYTPLSKSITGNCLIYMAMCGIVYFFAVLVLER